MTEFFDPPDADLADDISIRLETGEVVSLMEYKERERIVARGGEGSGHHGHAGRPGEVGGSLPSGARAGVRPTRTGIESFRLEVTDAYEGQMNGTLTAKDEDGDMIGVLEWIEFQNEVSIQSFFSEKISGRRDVYKALREQLKEEFPDAMVKTFDIGVEEIVGDEAELEPLPEIEYIPFGGERDIMEMARNERAEGRFVYPTIDSENERYVMIRSLDLALEMEADKIRGLDHERFVAFTEKEGREFEKDGDATSVRFSIYEMFTIQGHAERMRARNKRFVTMHNHPADDRHGISFPPSLSDFQSAIASGASEFRVIVPNGEYRVEVLHDYDKDLLERMESDWKSWEESNVDGYIPDRPADRDDRQAWQQKMRESEDFTRRYSLFQTDRVMDIENASETFDDYFNVEWRPYEGDFSE